MVEFGPRGKSGIMVNGQPLEAILAKETAVKLSAALLPENIVPYTKPLIKYIHKESDGATRVLTRREINLETWEKTMYNQDTIDGIVASILLSGREATTGELRSMCIKQLDVSKAKFQQRISYLMNKTDFGKFVERRREGRGSAYKLVPATLELKSEELLAFVYKGNSRERAIILSQHKGLIPYFSDEEQPASTITGLPVALDINVKVEVTFKWEK